MITTDYIKSLANLERSIKKTQQIAEGILREAEATLSNQTYANKDEARMVHAREAKAFAKKVIGIDMDSHIDAKWDDRRISA